MKRYASPATMRGSFNTADFADAGKVHVANKSPLFDIGDFIDAGRVHIANKSPAFDVELMDEAA